MTEARYTSLGLPHRGTLDRGAGRRGSPKASSTLPRAMLRRVLQAVAEATVRLIVIGPKKPRRSTSARLRAVAGSEQSSTSPRSTISRPAPSAASAHRRGAMVITKATILHTPEMVAISSTRRRGREERPDCVDWPPPPPPRPARTSLHTRSRPRLPRFRDGAFSSCNI